jgi:hypothetical protein
MDEILLKLCLSEIREWMSANFLKLNQDKTELMVFAPKHRVQDVAKLSISFGGCVIHDTPYVKNLGAHTSNVMRSRGRAT